MVGVMIPVHCTIVPISSIASSLGAKNSYWFLVLVYIAFNLAQSHPFSEELLRCTLRHRTSALHWTTVRQSS